VAGTFGFTALDLPAYFISSSKMLLRVSFILIAVFAQCNQLFLFDVFTIAGSMYTIAFSNVYMTE